MRLVSAESVRPFGCVRSSVLPGSCSHGSNNLGRNSGQRGMIRMNGKPGGRYAWEMMAYGNSGTQSTACATNDAFCTPSVINSGFSDSRTAPRGVVLLFMPTGEVGDACFLVNPYTWLSCRITVRFML